MGNFVAGISVFCFAASYFVALVLEISRIWFRSGVRGALLVGFAVAGLFAHTLFLGYRAYTAHAAPLSSPFDWYLVSAWFLTACYLTLTIFRPKIPVGLFALPLVLLLIAVAEFRFDDRPLDRGDATQVWGLIHGISLVGGTVAVAVGCMTGLMYLIQARRLKNKRPPNSGLRLPSLEWLERSGERAIVVSVLMLAIGVASGVVLNMLRQRLDWLNPVILASGFMFAWVLATALFSAVYKPARRGRKVAYLTLTTFLLLVIVLIVFVVRPHPIPSDDWHQQSAQGPIGGPGRFVAGTFDWKLQPLTSLP